MVLSSAESSVVLQAVRKAVLSAVLTVVKTDFYLVDSKVPSMARTKADEMGSSRAESLDLELVAMKAG